MKCLRHDNSVSNYYKTHVHSINNPDKPFPIYTQSFARFLHISSANINGVIRVQSNYEDVDNNNLNMCNYVLATAHADGLVLLRARPSAGAMKSECRSRVYTDRAVKVVDIKQITGMELGGIILQYCARSRLWPPLILPWVFSTVSALQPLERHTTCLVSLPQNNPNCCHHSKKSTKRCNSIREYSNKTQRKV